MDQLDKAKLCGYPPHRSGLRCEREATTARGTCDPPNPHLSTLPDGRRVAWAAENSDLWEVVDQQQPNLGPRVTGWTPGQFAPKMTNGPI